MDSDNSDRDVIYWRDLLLLSRNDTLTYVLCMLLYFLCAFHVCGVHSCILHIWSHFVVLLVSLSHADLISVT